jgi:hypothetical protein
VISRETEEEDYFSVWKESAVVEWGWVVRKNEEKKEEPLVSPLQIERKEPQTSRHLHS